MPTYFLLYICTLKFKKQINMRKIIYSFLALGAIAISSCTSDPCKDVSCSGNGTTVPSSDNKTCSCKCNIGFTGSRCDSAILTNLPGLYDVSEISGTRTFTNIANVRLGSNYQLNIDSLAGYKTNSVTMKVKGASLEIARQDPNSGIPATTYIETVSDGKIQYNASNKPVLTFTYKQTGSTGSTGEFQCTMTKR